MSEMEKEENGIPTGKAFAVGVGKRIKQARKKKALSQEELAQRLGLSGNSISMAEKGDQLISFEKMARLAKALGVPLDSLAYGAGNEDQAAAQTETQQKNTLRDYGQSMLDMIHDLGADLCLEDVPEETAGFMRSDNPRKHTRCLRLCIPLANFEASDNDYGNSGITPTDDIEKAEYIQPINISPCGAPLQRFSIEIRTAAWVQNEESKKIMIRNAVNDLPSDPLSVLAEKNKRIREAQQKERNKKEKKRQQEEAQRIKEEMQRMRSDDIPF